MGPRLILALKLSQQEVKVTANRILDQFGGINNPIAPVRIPKNASANRAPRRS